MATTRDVALAADVSVTTDSRVVDGDAPVHSLRRPTVKDTVPRLDDRPDAGAGISLDPALVCVARWSIEAHERTCLRAAVAAGGTSGCLLHQGAELIVRRSCAPPRRPSSDTRLPTLVSDVSA